MRDLRSVVQALDLRYLLDIFHIDQRWAQHYSDSDLASFWHRRRVGGSRSDRTRHRQDDDRLLSGCLSAWQWKGHWAGILPPLHFHGTLYGDNGALPVAPSSRFVNGVILRTSDLPGGLGEEVRLQGSDGQQLMQQLMQQLIFQRYGKVPHFTTRHPVVTTKHEAGGERTSTDRHSKCEH